MRMQCECSISPWLLHVETETSSENSNVTSASKRASQSARQSATTQRKPAMHPICKSRSVRSSATLRCLIANTLQFLCRTCDFVFDEDRNIIIKIEVCFLDHFLLMHVTIKTSFDVRGHAREYIVKCRPSCTSRANSYVSV